MHAQPQQVYKGRLPCLLGQLFAHMPFSHRAPAGCRSSWGHIVMTSLSAPKARQECTLRHLFKCLPAVVGCLLGPAAAVWWAPD
ncbi:rCG63440 [Rattus norvegicus]|uniref:RCG63440 n=1 Tax=Rattus norvegicus TaxID=10116 RepID=A6HAL0_RAT|nr:rCG63440 [Rattus norvegicus]